MKHFDYWGMLQPASYRHMLAIGSFAAITGVALTSTAPGTAPAAPIFNQRTPAPIISAPTVSDTAAEQPPSGGAGVPGSTTNNTSQTSITVNGQNIPVPQQGASHQMVSGDNGQTSVDISVERSHADTTNSSTMSLHISLQSTTGKSQTEVHEHSPPE